MKYLSKDNSYAITLFSVRVSETELEIYESCLDYFVKHLDNNVCESESGGATRDELESMRDSLRHIIMSFFDKNDLPEKAKDWEYVRLSNIFETP